MNFGTTCLDLFYVTTKNDSFFIRQLVQEITKNVLT